MAPPAPKPLMAAAALLMALLVAAAPARAARVSDLFAGVLRDADSAAQTAAAAAAAAEPATARPRGGGPEPQPAAAPGPLPLVMWHGMGDSCCAMGSIGGVAKFVESRLGVFVHSIATGEGELRDVASSFYGNVNDQVAAVCEELTTSPELSRELAGGFNMVGFSQGGQFLRAVVQRCGHELPGPVHALVTLGAQHAGVSNAPACAGLLPGGSAGAACSAVQTALAAGAYSPWVRDHIVQAQYFKAPGDVDEYLKRNVFLPDINNERVGGEDVGGGGGGTTAALYKKNLASLERLVLFKFQNDSTVEPSESSFFGFWGEDGTADDGKIVPLCESRLYKEDLLGLRELDERGAAAGARGEGGGGGGGGGSVCGGGGAGDGGKQEVKLGSNGSGGLVFDLVPNAEHMQFSMKWFEASVMDAWLAPAPKEGWLSGARARQREAAALAAAALAAAAAA